MKNKPTGEVYVLEFIVLPHSEKFAFLNKHGKV